MQPHNTFYRLVSLFRNINFDTFVGGAIFGALFSLLVNIMTFAISDEIVRQRALESIENEITLNNALGNDVIGANNKMIADKDLPNVFYSYHKYNTSVWTNPSTLQYIEQLDPNIQIEISQYYQIVIEANSAMDKLNAISQPILQQCFQFPYKPLSANIDKYCRSENGELLYDESTGATQVVKRGLVVINGFHPTRDRLHNPFLMLMMGNKAIGALKVPPKL